MKTKDSLALVQLERRLKPLRTHLENTKLRKGWIHTMRISLGMSLKNLADRAGISVPTAAQSEKREVQGKVTVETLHKMAAAMECEFIYAFVPKSEIKTLIKEKALAKAQRILAKADTHMTLEDQKFQQSMKERIERLADTLEKEGDVW